MGTLTINVTFTGICAFVEHQGGAIVVIPNASAIKGVTVDGEHAHVPSHLPFLEYNVEQEGVTAELPILLSYSQGGSTMNVLEIIDAVGMELTFANAKGDPGQFVIGPPLLNWSNVVDMDQVLGSGYPIDASLVSRFDPRSDRISARLSIDKGAINPRQQTEANATFLPSAAPPYSRFFVQEVVWTLEYEGGERCELQRRPFGSPTQPGDAIVSFDGKKSNAFEITIGNAPIEDIVRSGSGALEIVDHHFALYYDLLSMQPSVMRLPHRTSEKLQSSRTGGANCPPAKISLGG